MVHNEFLTLRRAGVRRMTREKDWVESTTGEVPEMDQHASAEASLINQEQLALVQALLNDLPERTRSIFKCFRMDGTSQKAIAAELGISLSAVEKHLARAYEAITRAKMRLNEESVSPRHLTRRGGDDAR
jgi:RNA polymerase sigma factor (sigma-70 family)